MKTRAEIEALTLAQARGIPGCENIFSIEIARRRPARTYPAFCISINDEATEEHCEVVRKVAVVIRKLYNTYEVWDEWLQ
ncbi:hypothetical protein [Methylobacterium nodulans]|nr:hypothetical protein [Methylobacterium nodulans]